MFYRHEPKDYFQIDPPEEFTQAAEREKERDLDFATEHGNNNHSFPPPAGFSSKSGGKTAKTDNNNSTMATIRQNESVSDFVQRFKEELYYRRAFSFQQYSKEMVTSTTADQERFQKNNSSSTSASSANEGNSKLSASSIVTKIRRFTAVASEKEGNSKMGNASSNAKRSSVFSKKSPDGTTKDFVAEYRWDGDVSSYLLLLSLFLSLFTLPPFFSFIKPIFLLLLSPL